MATSSGMRQLLLLAAAASAVQGWRAGPTLPRGAARLIQASRVGRSAVALSTPASPLAAPRTLSDCERAFEQLYAKPVYPPYSGIVDELFSSLVLTLADGRFKRTSLFALGLYTILSQSLVKPPTVAAGVQNRPTNAELAAAVCAALELDWESIERDGKGARRVRAGPRRRPRARGAPPKPRRAHALLLLPPAPLGGRHVAGMLEWASGLTEAELCAIGPESAAGADGADSAAGVVASGPGPADGVGAVADAPVAAAASGSGSGPFSVVRNLFSRASQEYSILLPLAPAGPAARAAGQAYTAELRALASDKYAFYHRCIGVGLWALLRATSAQSTARVAALERLSSGLGLKAAKAVRDVAWWQGALERVHDSEERKLVSARAFGLGSLRLGFPSARPWRATASKLRSRARVSPARPIPSARCRQDDEVRKLQQLAAKLQAEADEAQRRADEAEGIAQPAQAGASAADGASQGAGVADTGAGGAEPPAAATPASAADSGIN